jgi:hypothetical protein
MAFGVEPPESDIENLFRSAAAASNESANIFMNSPINSS